jgi:hypothetical protein
MYVIKFIHPSLVAKDTCGGSYQIYICIYCSKKEREKTRALNVHSKMESLPVSKMCSPYLFIPGLFSDGLVTQDYAVMNGHMIPK